MLYTLNGKPATLNLLFSTYYATLILVALSQFFYWNHICSEYQALNMDSILWIEKRMAFFSTLGDSIQQRLNNVYHWFFLVQSFNIESFQYRFVCCLQNDFGPVFNVNFTALQLYWMDISAVYTTSAEAFLQKYCYFSLLNK